MASDARDGRLKRLRPPPLGPPEAFQEGLPSSSRARPNDIGAAVMVNQSTPLLLCQAEFGIQNAVCSTEARDVQALQKRQQQQWEQHHQYPQHQQHLLPNSSGYGDFHSINGGTDELEPLLSPDATPVSSVARNKRASFPFFPAQQQQQTQHQPQLYDQQRPAASDRDPVSQRGGVQEHRDMGSGATEREKRRHPLLAAPSMADRFRKHRSEVVAVACVALVLFAVALTVPFTAQKTCDPAFVQTISLLQRDAPYSSKWSMAIEVIPNTRREESSSSSSGLEAGSRLGFDSGGDGVEGSELAPENQEQPRQRHHTDIAGNMPSPSPASQASAAPFLPSPSSSSSSVHQPTATTLSSTTVTTPNTSTTTATMTATTTTAATLTTTSTTTTTRTGPPLPRDTIYGIPNWAPSVLVLDATTEHAVKNSMAFGGSMSDSWSSGVLAPNGKIYGVPYNANSVLVIDPGTNTADITSMPVGGGTAQWSTGVLAGTKNLIFAIPLSATAVLVIDPNTDTVDSTSMAGFDHGCCKWVAAVLEPSTDKIYAVPADVSSVLVVDPNTLAADTTTLASFNPTPAGWTAAVLAGNGMVFAVPGAATSVLVIDTHNNTTDTTSIHGLSAIPSKWSSGVRAPTGKVFMIPHAADAVLIVDPDTLTADMTSMRVHTKGLHAPKEQAHDPDGARSTRDGGGGGGGDDDNDDDDGDIQQSSSSNNNNSSSSSNNNSSSSRKSKSGSENGRHVSGSVGTPRGDGWTAPVYDPETGLLFAMPTQRPKQTHNHRYHHSRVLVMDPVREKAKLVALPLRDGGWSHAILSKNGKIYAVPGDAPFALVIDPTLLHTCPHN